MVANYFEGLVDLVSRHSFLCQGRNSFVANDDAHPWKSRCWFLQQLSISAAPLAEFKRRFRDDVLSFIVDQRELGSPASVYWLA